LLASNCREARALLPLVQHSWQNVSNEAEQRLEELVSSWWSEALAANMVNPQIVKLSSATRMDTHAACNPPEGIYAQAVQEMQLSKVQEETIAAAYCTYLQALPERQRRHVLHHLAAAVEEPSSYLTEPVGMKVHDLLDQLTGVLGKWQEACMALTTVGSGGNAFGARIMKLEHAYLMVVQWLTMLGACTSQ
jgi:hypothetical protein